MKVENVPSNQRMFEKPGANAANKAAKKLQLTKSTLGIWRRILESTEWLQNQLVCSADCEIFFCHSILLLFEQSNIVYESH